MIADSIVITGGHVVDPANGRDELLDIWIRGGRLAAVDIPGSFDHDKSAQRVSAVGKIVTPGLVDFHAHVYRHTTIYGVDADRVGVHAGVTTLCDQGSAGHYTYGGLQRYVIDRAVTDVYAYLMINAVGMPQGGVRCPPLFSPDSAEVDATVECIEGHRDRIRGIKAHIDPNASARWGMETFRRGIAAARKARVPLYAHSGALLAKDPDRPEIDADALMAESLGLMSAGDIVGHCFGGMAGTIVTKDQRVNRAALGARDRGILFDVGYGVHFSWEAARIVLDAGITPDICSSDIHGDFRIPVREDPVIEYSMVGAMNRMLALGLGMSEVIRMSTCTPARVMGIQDRAGSLTEGFPADITLLDRQQGQFELTDSFGRTHATSQRLIPHLTIKRGVLIDIDRTLPEYARLTA